MHKMLYGSGLPQTRWWATDPEPLAILLQKDPMLKMLRILIADDQGHARRSLRALLATRFKLLETYEAVNGVEAVRYAEKLQPDVVLMDVRMPEMDGIEATRIIKTKSPELPVIVLSMYAEYRTAALAAGAHAFVLKGEPAEQLLSVLLAACSTN